jgi:hypothetical protein
MSRLVLALLFPCFVLLGCRPSPDTASHSGSVDARGRVHENITRSGSPQQGRASPHETISSFVAGNRITIVYGRPYTNDPTTGKPRQIWGTLNQFGKIWRMGADEATLFITHGPIRFGDLAVPAGAYTLYLLPQADGSAEFIVNKEIGQWGIDPYNEQYDLGRVKVRGEPLERPIHQFTIEVQPRQDGGGEIRLMWEDRQFVVPFAVEKQP